MGGNFNELRLKVVPNRQLVSRFIEDIQIVSAHAVGARIIAERLGVTAEYDALIASLESGEPAGLLEIAEADA